MNVLRRTQFRTNKHGTLQSNKGKRSKFPSGLDDQSTVTVANVIDCPLDSANQQVHTVRPLCDIIFALVQNSVMQLVDLKINGFVLTAPLHGKSQTRSRVKAFPILCA